MLYILISLVLSISTLVEASYRYPNCLQNLPTSITTNSFDRNFLDLTSFLFEAEDQQLRQAAQNAILYSDYTDADILIIDNRTNYLFLLVCMSSLCVIAFVVRTSCRKMSCLQEFTSKGMTKVISPCLVILSCTIFILVIIIMAIVPEIPADYATASCGLQQITESIKNGDLSSNWSGTRGQISHLQAQIEYLKVIETLPSTFDYSRQIMNTFIQSHYNFTNDLLSQYGSGQLPVGNQTIAMSGIIPQLFDNSNPHILNAINESIMALCALAKISSDIELSVEVAKESVQDAQLSLASKIKYYKTEEQAFQFVFSDFISRKQIYRNITQSAFLPLLMKVFIVLGLVCSSSYALSVVLGGTNKDQKFTRMADISWFFYLLIMVVGIYILYSLFQIATKQAGQCKFYEILKDDSQLYLNISSEHIRDKNAFIFFYPCLFGNGTFNDLTHTKDIQDNIKHVMGNFTQYTKQMDISSGLYKQSYSFKSAIEKALQAIAYSQVNIGQNAEYLKEQVTELNEYAYNDKQGDSCYKHIWAFSKQDCKNLPIVQYPLIRDLTNLDKEFCILFYKESDIGVPERPILFEQFMSYYGQDQPESGCTASTSKILQLGRSITDQLSLIYGSLQTLKTQLEEQSSQLIIFLTLLRRNYLLKQSQYQYLATLANSIELNKQAKNYWESAYSVGSECGFLKDKINVVFSIDCLKLKANILKVYLIMVLVLLFVGLAIVLGVEYGFNREVESFVNIEDEDAQSEALSQGKGRAGKIDSKKFIYEFFKAKIRKKKVQNKQTAQ